MLAPFDIEVIPQSALGIDSPEETGLSFVENAILKARHAAKLSGLPALADDSGLSIDALGGAPGIYSARYSGPDATDQSNIEKALQALKTVPDGQRGAQFNCVLAFLRHADDPVPVLCHGVWTGQITREVRGQGGFGYDPIFWVPDMQCSAAELTKVEKNKISHRGKALKQLMENLESIKGTPGTE